VSADGVDRSAIVYRYNLLTVRTYTTSRPFSVVAAVQPLMKFSVGGFELVPALSQLSRFDHMSPPTTSG
jgi:hypothetical protein